MRKRNNQNKFTGTYIEGKKNNIELTPLPFLLIFIRDNLGRSLNMLFQKRNNLNRNGISIIEYTYNKIKLIKNSFT